MAKPSSQKSISTFISSINHKQDAAFLQLHPTAPLPLPSPPLPNLQQRYPSSLPRLSNPPQLHLIPPITSPRDLLRHPTNRHPSPRKLPRSPPKLGLTPKLSRSINQTPLLNSRSPCYHRPARSRVVEEMEERGFGYVVSGGVEGGEMCVVFSE